MKSYDPNQAPNSKNWLALSEDERIELAEAAHADEAEGLPNINVHALFHVIIENQIALGDEIPVAGTLKRLMEEGLDRHEAVHAIASILANFYYGLFNDDSESEGEEALGSEYFDALAQLTAESWRTMLDDIQEH